MTEYQDLPVRRGGRLFSLPGLPYAFLLAFGMALGSLIAAPLQAQEDLLAIPAVPSEKASRSLLLDVVNTGERLVAVGERGHILYSDDQGKHWQQADVPVTVMLTAVHFATPRQGWAVGHDGVVLHTSDGGKRWHKQLDGYEANRLILDAYQAKAAAMQEALEAAAEEQQEELEYALEELTYKVEEARAAVEEGPSKPFMDVWFKNEQLGYVIGAYGMIFRTEDGGNSWQSWEGRVPNPDGFHLNAIIAVNGKWLLMVGEAGTLYRSLDDGESWEALDSVYDGSYFGAVSLKNDKVIAFGLRGNAFLSRDRGESWEHVSTKTAATLSAGSLLADDSLLLVGAGGTLLHSVDSGRSFTVTQSEKRLPYSAIVQAGDKLVLVGVGGVSTVAVNRF